MEAFFENVLTTSFHGSIVILAVLILRLVLRKTPKKFICFLWALAGLRLLIPVPLESRFSLQPTGIPIPESVSLSGWMTAAWVVIAFAIAAYSAVSYWQLRRKTMDAVKVPGGWESDRIETAFVLGFIRPKIYIPVGMPSAARKQILAHERTHLDKGDHWIKMIGFLALAIHWFNPLAWLAYILLCKDIEMACDERVVQFMELDERKAYASALLQCSTNRVHYAACPVAFGEVSVKYRIRSALNYKKPGFWISLLGIAAIVFVAVCLVPSPRQQVEIVVDQQEKLAEASRQNPVAFTVPVQPPTEANPDWGVELIADITSPIGGTMVYRIEERFAASSEVINMQDMQLEKWNGTDWESVCPVSSQMQYVYFAQHRDMPVNYHTEDISWELRQGSLGSGDYRIAMQISSATETAVFHAPFHIYREELPREEEAALAHCTAALEHLLQCGNYSVTLSETGPNGTLSPTCSITCTNGENWMSFYYGSFQVSTITGDDARYRAEGWEKPFRLDQNRQFLFPEGQSRISDEEISFCSVWADYAGRIYRGTDTWCFAENGTLKSVERCTDRIDDQGSILDTQTIRLEVTQIDYLMLPVPTDNDSYVLADSFDAQKNSPWGIFFRVDDDYLQPTGGEIWLGTDAVGVSGYYADGAYWMEKRNGTRWERLGGEDREGSWTGERIPLGSRTTVCNVDWSGDYGRLDAGVYRMGKRFYNGEESIIQYAEFRINASGGVFGENGEELLNRVDAAIDKLMHSSVRAEQYGSGYSEYDPQERLASVYWLYGDTQIWDIYSQNEYSHSVSDKPGGFFYGDWLKRSWNNEEYDCMFFDQEYNPSNDREIHFCQVYSRNDGEPVLHTYRFNEQGNLTEIIRQYSRGYIRYVITDTPESEIREWVEKNS